MRSAATRFKGDYAILFPVVDAHNDIFGMLHFGPGATWRAGAEKGAQQTAGFR